MQDEKNTVITLAARAISPKAKIPTQYLTVSKGQSKRFLIATASYDALAEASDYFNKDKDEYEIPEQINGQRVIGVEDGYIIGGVLGINMDWSGLEFEDPDDPELKRWLENGRWSSQVSVTDIKEALSQKG